MSTTQTTPQAIRLRPQQATPQPSVAVETITPDLAEQYLTVNVTNRRVRTGAVSRYARDMQAGAWGLNGSTITFNRKGEMLDGQHRMLAIMKAGVAVQMLVVRGVDEAAMATIDTGMPRLFADVLHLQGIANARMVAAAARWWYRYDKNLQDNVDCRLASHQELQTYVATHPTLIPSASLISARAETKALITPSVTTFVHAYVSERDQAAADLFIGQIEDPSNLKPTDSVYLLRKAMVLNMSSRRKMPPEMTLALVIKAFNATYQGNAMQSLRYRPNVEAFPKFAI